MNFRDLKINLVLLLLFSSCDNDISSKMYFGNVEEEIYVNNENSGKYIIYRDLIEPITVSIENNYKMYRCCSGVDRTELSDDEISIKSKEEAWQGFPLEIDSVICFADFYKDRVFDTIEKKELALRSFYFTKGEKIEGNMDSGIYNFYETDVELNAFMNLFKEIYLEKLKERFYIDFGNENNKFEVIFNQTKNSLSREVNYDLPEVSTFEDKIRRTPPWVRDIKITTRIHTPGEIKKVVGEGVKEQKEKEVIFEYKAIDILMNPRLLNFKIEMEK